MARTASVTVRMERSLREALERKASAEGRSLASTVRRALRESLEAGRGQLAIPFGECAHPMSRRYRDVCQACGQRIGVDGHPRRAA